MQLHLFESEKNYLGFKKYYCLRILSLKKINEKRVKANHQLRKTLSVLNTDDRHVSLVPPLWHRLCNAKVVSWMCTFRFEDSISADII